MKANNGNGNNELRDLWETPKSFFDKLNSIYKFEFDCCANETNRKTKKYSNDFQSINSLDEICWMNPAFSKAKEMFIHFFKVVKSGVAIYRCDNLETKLWQEIIFKNADWIFIPKGRINYEGFNGKSARFPSALIGVNIKIPTNIEGIPLFIK